MAQKKSTDKKKYQENTLLDNILWFIENYLPQKKKRSSHSKLSLDKYESFTIKKIEKFALNRSRSLQGNLINTTVTFRVGSWALPYLNYLKRIKLLK
tara:strand:- start:432 stop:722 length:291 start_codon:yes stop_codon:yes gene_type:complete